jgi:hypothetical protein
MMKILMLILLVAVNSFASDKNQKSNHLYDCGSMQKGVSGQKVGPQYFVQFVKNRVYLAAQTPSGPLSVPAVYNRGFDGEFVFRAGDIEITVIKDSFMNIRMVSVQSISNRRLSADCRDVELPQNAE